MLLKCSSKVPKPTDFSQYYVFFLVFNLQTSKRQNGCGTFSRISSLFQVARIFLFKFNSQLQVSTEFLLLLVTKHGLEEAYSKYICSSSDPPMTMTIVLVIAPMKLSRVR